MRAALLLALFAADPAPPGVEPEPSPVPSGMDLLYSDRVPILPSGEPLIALGLMSGQRQAALSARAPLQVDYYEAGVLKRTTVRAGARLEVGIGRTQPAARRYYVDLEGVGRDQPERLDWALSGWRARGYPQVEALEHGTVLGIGGHVLDNREYRVVLPVASAAEGRRLASEVYARFGTRAFVSARLGERPWGELRLRAGGAPLGTATSFIRCTAGEQPVLVEAVEQGKGYSWHGFADRSFRGEIYVVVDPDGRLAVVNVLGAEQVLAGVVPAEMFASSPAEALKAQAVAARNQLFAKLGKRHHDDPFHLCAEQHCQVYGGVDREDPRTNAAVRETAGEVAFREGRLVDTVYSSTCGGHGEDNDAVWGNDPDPALRARPDYEAGAPLELVPTAAGVRAWLTGTPTAYCAKASKVRPEKLRWRTRLPAAELQTLVGAAYPKLGPVTRLEVEERGRGGRVISLAVHGEGGTATVVHELPIRQLFGNLNSGAFVIDEERDAAGKLVAVTFIGGGWGHGVGMCQLGAIGRAEAGQSYREILAHYYNGAITDRLYPAR